MAWYEDFADPARGNLQGLVNALRNPSTTTPDNSKLANQLRAIPDSEQYIRGNLLPFKKDIKTKEVSFGMPTVAQDLLSAISAPIRAYRGEIDPNTPQGVQEAMNVGLNFMGAGSAPALGKINPQGQLGITAWHGSPHTFDAFDLSKARTGHGAQAYSHGAYLSDAIDVGKGYQPRSDKLENAIGKLSEKADNANNYVATDIYDNFLLHKTPDEIAKSIKESEYSGQDLINANQALQQGANLYKKHSSGGLYKVDLPDEHLQSFLQWDKPLHEQPKPVYDALMKAGNVSDNFTKQLLAGGTGEDIYTSLFNAHQLGKIPGKGASGVDSEKAASEFLKNLGIKGTTYFDRNSPGSGSGANNYVIYDPSILKILERNGIAIK